MSSSGKGQSLIRTDKDIDAAMSGNICRCGTYTRIKKAIHQAVAVKNDRV